MSNNFKMSVLASSSKGNSIYVESDKKKILIDAGLSGKKIVDQLTAIHVDPKDLDAIFVTHEHQDHVRGVGVLARKYELDVYANTHTWQAMLPMIGKVNQKQCYTLECGVELDFGDMIIKSFPVSHDAAQPQFYQIYAAQKSLVILTDTGYCNDYLKQEVKGADTYIIESNHDVHMLRHGSYPWKIKQRILGDSGHLSNEDSARIMHELITDNTKHIYLGHLSTENNLKSLAHMTMKQYLELKDHNLDKDLFIYDTDPYQATLLTDI